MGGSTATVIPERQQALQCNVPYRGNMELPHETQSASDGRFQRYFRRSATPPTSTPSSTAWSITPTGSTSAARACGVPVSPAARPEPVALWTCRCAWTTPRALPTCPQQQQKTIPSRFKIDPAASPMPETRLPERLPPRATSNRNGGRDHLDPGRDQIGIPGRDHRSM
jgi:hypothetical protein